MHELFIIPIAQGINYCDHGQQVYNKGHTIPAVVSLNN